MAERPFRSPHHSASVVGLVGGGAHPKPGEISLSHLGVLFLDELTEFSRSHLDNLRQPLETKRVVISRAGQTVTYPASFVLVAACNPCPCGYKGDVLKYCACTSSQADRYWSRLSGPLLDRIDLQVEVSRLAELELVGETKEESSATILARVNRAVERQRLRNKRQGDGKFVFNSVLGQKEIAKYCAIEPDCARTLAQAVCRYGLSARAYDRILRLARTIADLADRDQIDNSDIGEALHYRLPAKIFR